MKKSWITSLRTFSNNSYWDPRYMNYGPIKVINDDTQQPGGFVPNHEHKNYDIISYVVEGELEHTDSLGNVSRARAGQIQRMWAGSSIWHTEACVGDTPARYLQIWITPNETNTPAEYQLYDRPAEFAPLPFQVKQDITIRAGVLSEPITTKTGYLYVVDGSCVVAGHTLTIGDGAEVEFETVIPVDAAHILLFE
jgi:redox-sensitive bicupin YhaK (pirin superfamily)